MGDRAKERDRKGWEERGMNYQGSSGRRDSPIKPYLSGIYNYIMMHPLPHQVNWQSLFLAHPTPLLSCFPLNQPVFAYILSSGRLILPSFPPVKQNPLCDLRYEPCKPGTLDRTFLKSFGFISHIALVKSA